MVTSAVDSACTALQIQQAAVTNLPTNVADVVENVSGQCKNHALHPTSLPAAVYDITLRLLIPKQSARFRKVFELVLIGMMCALTSYF
jgi:hypothetical protein